jgi:hypothetical protein
MNEPLISGICPECKEPIYSSTYADWCKCGASDFAY